jgi:SAM-dependent methyltransferase
VNDVLRAVLTPDAKPRLAETEIWSSLPPEVVPPRFDAIAARYDRIVSHPLYLRLAWGGRLETETAFAARALASADGIALDAGCGSLCFTADAHATSGRATLCCDLSLGMLRLARGRLLERGGVPSRMALFQADLLSAPLRDGAFRSVLCPGILHLFADPLPLLRRLDALLEPAGTLFLSCLVTDRGVGRAYLRLLARAGEVALLTDAEPLRELVARATGRPTRCERVGNFAYLECGPRGARA